MERIKALTMKLEDLSKEMLIGHLPEALFLEDFEGNILDVNIEACLLLGYEKEELLKQQVEDLVPEESPVLRAEEIEQATKASKPIETVNIREDGTKVPVELRGRIIEGESKGRILVTVRDISQRKEAEARLKQSRKRYQGYFEELGDAVFITKVGGEDHGLILDVNSAAEAQTGYSRQELIGMHIEEDIAVEEPKSLTYEEGDKKLARGEMVNFREKKRRKDGTEFWTEVVVTRVDHEGTVAALSINRDITERKRAKEQLQRYKMAVEGSEDLMAACDKDYNYLFANGIYKDFYEIGEEGIKGYHVRDLVGDDAFKNTVKPRIDRCLRGERIEYEMKRTHPTKGPRHLRIMYYPLRGEARIHGVVAVMRDITEQKRTQQTLNEERDKLRRLHDAVEELQHKGSEEELLQATVDVAEAMLEFEQCAIAILKGDYLIPRANSADLDPEDTTTFKVGEGIAGKTVEKGESIWGDDVRNFSEGKPANKDFRAFISVPIGDVGVFQVISEEIGSFTKQDVELAEILVSHLQEELNRVRLERELRHQAIRDPLTDLYNRRYFSEFLGEEVEKCKRYGKSIAFLMADVNRFKEINDRYSHQTGDEVLKEVAGLLKENVRDADTVVRYGGDEFLVMMTQTEGGVTNTVDRLKASIDQWNHESDLLDFPLSLALGVSYWNTDQDRDVENALKEADRNMYEDKTR